jgi:biotin carboxyl carrier protein
MKAQRFVATVGKARHEVAIAADGEGRFRITVGGRERTVDARQVEPGVWSLLEAGGGAQRLVEVEGRAPVLQLLLGALQLQVELADARRARAEARLGKAAATDGPQPVRAPMPGKVVKVLAQVGDAVKAGQGVVVVEAMKMENELRAPRDGKVMELQAREGQAVEAGQTLATVG